MKQIILAIVLAILCISSMVYFVATYQSSYYIKSSELGCCSMVVDQNLHTGQWNVTYKSQDNRQRYTLTWNNHDEVVECLKAMNTECKEAHQ